MPNDHFMPEKGIISSELKRKVIKILYWKEIGKRTLRK